MPAENREPIRQGLQGFRNTDIKRSSELRPILKSCEGVGCPVHGLRPGDNRGVCSMCGVLVCTDDDGLARPHDREDVLAMVERGDFG